MWLAFGDPPDSGARNANAPGAKASTPTSARPSAAMATRRRPRGRGRDGTERGLGVPGSGRYGGKTRGILFTVQARPLRSGSCRSPRARAASCTREAGLALLGEGGDTLQEVPGVGHLALDARLELQLLGHAGVEPAIQLALDPGVGPGRPAGQPRGQGRDLGVAL